MCFKTKPTMALIGESGPDAVVPVSKGKSSGFGGTNIGTVNVVFPNADLRTVDPTMAKNMVVRAIKDAVNSGELNRSVI